MLRVPAAQADTIVLLKAHILHASGDPVALSVCPAADIANYLSDAIEIRAVPGKGRGLFLTRPVTEDEPLLVERALERAVASHRLVGQEELIGRVLRRCAASATDDARVALLCGGPRESMTPAISMLTLQFSEPANAAAAPEQTRTACCSATHVRTVVKFYAFDATSSTMTSCALFLVAAFLNHAEERTAERVIEDGVFFLRARTALQAGTELNASYYTGAKPSQRNF